MRKSKLLRRSPELVGPFVHQHDTGPIPDVCTRSLTALTRGLGAPAAAGDR
jgi:hypothetical protein